MLIRLRRYMVAGLLVWLPVGATILVFRLLLGLMDRLLFWLPAAYRPEALIEINVPGLNAIVSGVLAFLLLAATGILAANFLGKRLVSWYESVLARIPFVRTVYGGVKNFAEVLFSDTDSSFKRVLLIEYPRKGLYCLVFQTSENASEVQMRTGETVISVFLPTTPNPTSGFILFVPKKDAVELEMSVEDALKLIVSLGVVVPPWHPVHPDRAKTIEQAPGTAAGPAGSAPATFAEMLGAVQGEPVAADGRTTSSLPVDSEPSEVGPPEVGPPEDEPPEEQSGDDDRELARSKAVP